MKTNRIKLKSSMKWLLIILIVILISAAIYLFLFFQSNKDIKNVNLHGHIYDKIENTMLNEVNVTIINWRYTSDKGHNNYDEYLGNDTITVKTDNKGAFSVLIPLSSQIDIKVEKNGYHREEKIIDKVNKNITVDFYLKKQMDQNTK